MTESVPSSRKDDGDLVERIAKLEAALEDDKKSFTRRFSLWAGIVALVLSIAAGTLGIFDRVTDAFAFHDRQVARAKDIASELMGIATEGELLIAQGKLMEADAFSRTKNIEIMRHIGELNSMDRAVLADLSAGDLMAISWFSLTLGDQQAAIQIAGQAIENADDDLFEAEALRYRAIAKYATGDFQDIDAARDDMSSAMSMVTDKTAATAEGVRINVLVWWAASEAIMGDCNAANETISLHIDKVNSETAVFARWKSRVNDMILQAGSSCAIAWP